MSGSIAAIAAYNGTGTQGYSTTDKTIHGVKSVFYKDEHKYYVNGCSFSEVPSNVSEVSGNSPDTVIFTFDNDSDAINNIYLSINTNSKLQFSTSESLWEGLASQFISRIEICVGNQVISTINTQQLAAAVAQNTDSRTVLLDIDGKIVPASSVTSSVSYTLTASFKLPMFTTLEDAYLMACANNQTLQVKVYPKNLTEATYSSDTVAKAFNNIANTDDLKFYFSLFCNKFSMTNDERNYLRSRFIPKITNTTQFATLDNIPSSNITKDTPITLVCDHFNLYAEYIEVSFTTPNLSGIFDYELFLNSTSYCGKMSFGQAVANGLKENSIDDVTIIKIPLASKDSYGKMHQDFVPLSKFDSIRIVLTVSQHTGLPSSSDASQEFYNSLTAVCVGKCTALYQNGAVTFNNY